ncbi:MAG: hypothetical protein ACQUYJ_19120, partial [Ferruginibacter sp.]
FTGYSQLGPLLFTDIDFKEKQADTIDIKLDSILILGMGSSVTRIFLADMSNTMIKELNNQKIIVSYFYLGRNAEEANREFKLIDKTGYKAILFLLPTDTALLDTKYNTSTNRTESAYGPIASSTTTSRTSYQQTFNFQLCRVDKKNEKFWSASLDIDCDPGKKNAARKVVKKVFNRFRTHKYIE